MTRWVKIITVTALAGSGILYVILSPNYHPHPPRYDTLARQALRGFLGACSIYWAEHGGEKICGLEIATGQQDKLISGTYDYGFKPSSGIILAGSGNEKTFAATARHVKSKRSFHIDSSGEIVAIETKGGE